MIAIRTDYKSAELTPKDLAMLAFVEKLTLHAYRITEADHLVLKSHGFDEQGIVQITLLASWFNYINRVADALGVGK